MNMVKATEAQLGDLVICNGDYAPVTAIINWPPGHHPSSPIFDHVPAVELRTERGSRWYAKREEV